MPHFSDRKEKQSVEKKAWELQNLGFLSDSLKS